MTQAVMWMELRPVGEGAGHRIGPRCRQLYRAPGVGCFHCHTLSVMETKCSPRRSLKLSCCLMCFGQTFIDPISPHTVVSFFPSNRQSHKGSVFLDQLKRIHISQHFISCGVDDVTDPTGPGQVWFHEPDHMLHRTSSQSCGLNN